MNWNSLKKCKPPIDIPVLVFRQGFDITGEHYWWHIQIAEYVKTPYKKRLVFAIHIKREKDGAVYDGYPLDGTTHWIPLPEPPKRSKAFDTLKERRR